MKELTEQEINHRTQYNKIMFWLVIGGMVAVSAFGLINTL